MAVVIVALLAAGIVVGARAFLSKAAPPPSPSCMVATSTMHLRLDLSQAADAATIAAVAKRKGLADHAVTIALVASLQESKLHNLPSGDLDSVGLFQQRPSQGWGTPAQLIDPVYAATAFYDALVKVPQWATRTVGDVAQAVQHSAAPDAYEPWENQGRALAEAFTGEAAAALSCRYALPAHASITDPVDTAMAAELGAPATDTPVADARGWTVASWLVAHAYAYKIVSVSFLGQTWTPATGKWTPRSPSVDQVQFQVGRP